MWNIYKKEVIIYRVDVIEREYMPLKHPDKTKQQH